MKHLLLLSLVAGLMGCAHGFQVPESADDAKAMAQDEADTQKDALSDQANGQVADVQDQANAKVDGVKNQGMDMANGMKDKAANLVGNAAMSKAIAASVLQRMPLIGDSKTLVYANTVGQYVAQELIPSLKCRTDGTPWNEVRVAIVKSSTPASFSLPGGMVFVTTSLVQKMNSEDEFAGVIANEMVSSVCGKGVPSNLAMQAASGWQDYVLSLPTKSLNRADLAFADKYALVTLYRRGYDVTPYVNFIARNEKMGRHMYGADRAMALQKSIAATPPITPTASARLSRWKAAKAKAL